MDQGKKSKCKRAGAVVIGPLPCPNSSGSMDGIGEDSLGFSSGIVSPNELTQINEISAGLVPKSDRQL